MKNQIMYNEWCVPLQEYINGQLVNRYQKDIDSDTQLAIQKNTDRLNCINKMCVSAGVTAQEKLAYFGE